MIYVTGISLILAIKSSSAHYTVVLMIEILPFKYFLKIWSLAKGEISVKWGIHVDNPEINEHMFLLPNHKLSNVQKYYH